MRTRGENKLPTKRLRREADIGWRLNATYVNLICSVVNLTCKFVHQSRLLECILQYVRADLFEFNYFSLYFTPRSSASCIRQLI